MTFLTHEQYADYQQGAILSDLPPDWIQKHRDTWGKVLKGTLDAGGVHESVALTLARCEFLGSLYRGNLDKTNSLDAKAYIEIFIEHRRPEYGRIHNLVSRKNQQEAQSDIFMMFRNKVLHNVHPTAVETEDKTGVVAWRIGEGVVANDHLVLKDGACHIKPSLLIEHFIDSLDHFITYLRDDNDMTGRYVLERKGPQARWRRAHWARLCPHGKDNLVTWMMLGAARGVPA